jgi:hypothetical protein
MQRTSFTKLLAQLALRTALVGFSACILIHLAAAVSMPILQALSEGLQRVNTLQIAAVSQKSTTNALAGEVVHKQ